MREKFKSIPFPLQKQIISRFAAGLLFVFREFKGDAFDSLSETGCFDMLTDAFNAHVITLITIIEQQNRIYN